MNACGTQVIPVALREGGGTARLVSAEIESLRVVLVLERGLRGRFADLPWIMLIMLPFITI